MGLTASRSAASARLRKRVLADAAGWHLTSEKRDPQRRKYECAGERDRLHRVCYDGAANMHFGWSVAWSTASAEPSISLSRRSCAVHTRESERHTVQLRIMCGARGRCTARCWFSVVVICVLACMHAVVEHRVSGASNSSCATAPTRKTATSSSSDQR